MCEEAAELAACAGKGHEVRLGCTIFRNTSGLYASRAGFGAAGLYHHAPAFERSDRDLVVLRWRAELQRSNSCQGCKGHLQCASCKSVSLVQLLWAFRKRCGFTAVCGG